MVRRLHAGGRWIRTPGKGSNRHQASCSAILSVVTGMAECCELKPRVMEISIYSLLEGARRATGSVVVIDVFRAFTTAAVALANGASNIVMVSTVEEALALRESAPRGLSNYEQAFHRLRSLPARLRTTDHQRCRQPD